MSLLNSSICLHTIILFHFAYLLLQLLECIAPSQVSNLQIDVNHLIIVKDSFSSSSPHHSSLFGFSNVLLANEETGESWIVIGSPRSNTSDRDYRHIYEPGVLWRCSLTVNDANSLDDNHCRILFIDPIHTQTGKADCRPSSCPNETHVSSALGFTLAINSDRFVACAPKWSRSVVSNGTDDWKYNGLCYWVPIPLLLSTPFSMSSMISRAFRSQRLFPLQDSNMQISKNFPIWAWGQTGFSSHLTGDNELFLGAPGLNAWNGSIIKYQDGMSDSIARKNQGFYRIRPNNKNGTQAEFSLYSILRTDYLQLYYHVEYFGFSISSGKYFITTANQNLYRGSQDEDEGENDGYGDDDDYYYVSCSSPRGGRLYGLVFIFKYPSRDPIYWNPSTVLQGSQFGSYFGYSLLSIDCNGDGLDELIVGAPWQRNTQDDAGEATEGTETGCVFIYSASKFKSRFNHHAGRLICDSQYPGARFGSALASLGDLNGDGYEDFGIGAPGEADGAGAVYIYHGGVNFGLIDEHTQYELKLSPEAFNIIGGFSVKGFGFSIFGGVDIDNNGTPDFVIGSPESQAVIIYRTRPKLDFLGKLDIYINDNNNNSNDWNETINRNNNNDLQILPIQMDHFIIRSCVQIHKASNGLRSLRKNEKFKLDVQMKLTIDGEYERFQVLEPVEHQLVFEQIHNGTILYNTTLTYSSNISSSTNSTAATARNNCTEWIIIHNPEYEGKDELNPKPIRIIQELIYKDPLVHDTLSITNYNITRNARGIPELVVNEGSSVQDQFCSYCPSISQTRIELLIPIASDNCADDGVPTCTPALQCNLNFYFENYRNTSKMTPLDDDGKFIIGSTPELNLEIELLNLQGGETAYLPIIELAWNHSSFIPNVNFLESSLIQCTSSNESLKCQIDSTIQPNESIMLKIPFNLQNLYAVAKEQQITFNFSIKSLISPPTSASVQNGTSSSSQMDDAYYSINTSTNKTLLVIAETSLEFNGSIDNVSFPSNFETAKYTKLTQSYHLILHGISSVQAVQLTFWFPTRFKYSSAAPKEVQKHATEEIEDILLIGHPMGNGCRITKPANKTFYIDPDLSLNKKLNTRQIFGGRGMYFNDFNDGEGNEEWILPLNNNTLNKEPNETFIKSSFDKLWLDSKMILDSYASQLRCLHENDEFCVRVDCVIQHVAPNHDIVIKFPLYLNNVRLRRHFMKTREESKLLVQSLGQVQIFMEEDDDEHNIKLASFASLVSNPSYAGGNQGEVAFVPIIWIYIISIVIGLMILACMVYCLVKFGFFKREKPFRGWKPLNSNELNNETVGG